MSDKRYDGSAVLSRMSGLPRDEIVAMWEAVKKNNATLDACPRHQFDAALVVKMGDKVKCNQCGGTLPLTAISYYIRGYRAAGGNSDDIWPGWFAKKGSNDT